MRSRRTGRRPTKAAVGKRVRRTRGRANQAAAPLSQTERRRLAQLVICSCVFVLLVAAKLMLPERMADVNRKLSEAMERNMDVQSVFNAVGRAFSGEEDVGGAAEDIYQAVFATEEAEAVKTAASAALEPEQTGAMDTLREYRTEAEPTPEPPAAATLAYVLYSDQNLPEGVSLEQAILGFDYCSPLPGAALSSDFGYREHPTEEGERFHYGVDLAAETGTAIRCFADGTVKAVGESSSYGKYCIIDHEGGYSTLYAHCSRVTAVSGGEVSGGDTIAEVGETGMATGPHLHFELQRDGVYLNPVYYVSAL